MAGGRREHCSCTGNLKEGGQKVAVGEKKGIS